MDINMERPPVLANQRGAKIETGNTSSMTHPGEAVNIENPRLWRALRKFDRNLKKIVRLRERNAALLEEMRRLQEVS